MSTLIAINNYTLRNLTPFLFFVLSIYSIGTTATVHAQERELVFKNLSTKDGLSGSFINASFRDTDGIMWIGTSDGLNMYNGYEFRVFSNHQEDTASLSNNFVTAIHQDQQGTLWVGTSHGLNILNKDYLNFKRQLLIEEEKNDQVALFIKDIISDQEGVWVATTYAGVFFIPYNKADSIVQYDKTHLQTNRIFAMADDSKGNIWMGTEYNGIIKFNKQSKETTHLKYDENNPNSLKDNQIWSLAFDKNNHLWVGTFNKGIFRFDEKSNAFISYQLPYLNNQLIAAESIFDILKDHTGNIWAGTGNGLFRYDYEKDTFTGYFSKKRQDYSLSSSIVRSLYEDEQGIIWVGTYDAGINYTHVASNVFESYLLREVTYNGLNDPIVQEILVDQEEHIWFGTSGGGLNKYDPKTNTYRYYYKTSTDKNQNTIGPILLRHWRLITWETSG